jgi:hypothetical protein
MAEQKISTAKIPNVPQRKKEPDYYIFRLMQEFPKLHEGSAKHSVRTFIKTTDDILWTYYLDKEKDEWIPVDPYNQNKMVGLEIGYYQRSIRYVAGHPSIFVDEQTKNGELPEHYLNNSYNRDHLAFSNGLARIAKENRNAILFLHCMNQCKEQHPLARKLKSINATFELLDFGRKDQERVAAAARQEEAFEKARSAQEDIFIPHARYLGIPTVQSDNGEQRDRDAIRADYKKFALDNPDRFLESFNSPVITINMLVKAAIERGLLTIGGLVPDMASWNQTKEHIVNVPKDADPISFLSDYAQTKDGETFLTQIKAFQKAARTNS